MRFTRCLIVILALLICLSATGCSFLLPALPNKLFEIESASPESSVNLVKATHTARPTAKSSPSPASASASARPTGSKPRATVPPDGKLQAKFDLRSLGGVTPVRDQKAQDTCWDFAAIAAAESSAAYLSGISADFSENHMKYALSSDGGNKWGFSRPFDGGGNRVMAAAYFARRSGAVLEANDPYTPKSEKRPVKVTNSKKASYTVSDILYLPVDVGEKHRIADASDIEIIKRAVITYGGIFTDYMHDIDKYSSKYKSYYMPNSTKELSGFAHAVVLVGWDDNFKASKFTTKPPGDGAWIAKNSFGTAFGEKGYFYISYYDALIGSGATAFTGVVKVTKEMRAYQHDPFGNNCYFTASHIKTMYGANIFDRKEFGGIAGSESIEQIGLYTSKPNITVTISLGMSDETGSPTDFQTEEVKTATLEYAGYHTITLPKPYQLTAQYFCVKVEFQSDEDIQLAMEDRSDVSRQAEASEGESWTSWDGEDWTDLAVKEKNTNLCIKAFSIIK